jgi:hypothetical protein
VSEAFLGAHRHVGSSRTIIKGSKQAVEWNSATCRAMRACAACWACWRWQRCGCCSCGRRRGSAPKQAGSRVLPTDLVQVAAALAHVPVAQLSTQRCWSTITRYGGYLGRSADGPRGWKTLWKGWFSIQALLDGVHLAAQLSLD